MVEWYGTEFQRYLVIFKDILNALKVHVVADLKEILDQVFYQLDGTKIILAP